MTAVSEAWITTASSASMLTLLSAVTSYWLSLEHLGEYKVDAMAQEIKRVNPFAEVTTFRGLIQDAPKSLFGVVTPEEGIVIATGDNRMCAAQANAVAQQLDLPFVAIGCWVAWEQ